MPDSFRVLLIVGAAMALVAVALGVQHGVPLLTAALLATVAMMGPLAFVLIQPRPGEVIRERKAKGLCVRCGYDLTDNVSGVCPECGNAPVSGSRVDGVHRPRQSGLGYSAGGEGPADDDCFDHGSHGAGGPGVHA